MMMIYEAVPGRICMPSARLLEVGASARSACEARAKRVRVSVRIRRSIGAYPWAHKNFIFIYIFSYMCVAVCVAVCVVVCVVDGFQSLMCRGFACVVECVVVCVVECVVI